MLGLMVAADIFVGGNRLNPSTLNTRNMKKETSLTPFRSALKAFIFEFNDPAEALVFPA